MPSLAEQKRREAALASAAAAGGAYEDLLNAAGGDGGGARASAANPADFPSGYRRHRLGTLKTGSRTSCLEGTADTAMQAAGARKRSRSTPTLFILPIFPSSQA